MRAVAPGKLLLTGAYVVLEGSPAVVVAVDRYAVADSRVSDPCPSIEVRAAFGEERAPYVDVQALQHPSGRKLGLGSSAAGLVAALGARALEAGSDLRDAPVRDEIFRSGRRAHAAAQGGGSGVDVAASVYGGVLHYCTDPGGSGTVRRLSWPESLTLIAYDSGEVARTSDLLARVASYRALHHDPPVYGRLCDLAERAALTLEAGNGAEFIDDVTRFGLALGDLGQAAGVPIVPPRFAELSRLAAREGAAFIPSGAGGGDVAVWLSLAIPSREFSARARTLSMRRLPLCFDGGGIRQAFPVPAREADHGANV